VQAYGPDHPYTLAVRGNLAYWQGRAEDAVGAATTFDGLPADLTRVFGQDHPLAQTPTELGYWPGHAGTATGSAAAFEDLLADMLRVFAKDHPTAIRTPANLAKWRNQLRSLTHIADATVNTATTDGGTPT
jgi:hypothetical protein